MTGSMSLISSNTIRGVSKLISIRRATWRLSSACWRGGDILFLHPCRKRPRAKWSTSPTRKRALMFDKTLPVNSPSGMSDSGAESIWGLNITHNVVEVNVTTRDYNPRDAQSVLQSATADMTREMGKASLTVRYTTISFVTGSVAINRPADGDRQLLRPSRP